jgi:PAS domain S-box-containing protein
MLSMNQVSDLPTLDQVIDYAPLSIEPTAKAIDVITLMSQGVHHPIGYAIIVENFQPIGILTQQDVVRLAVAGIDFAQVKIFEVMTQPVITLKQADIQDISTTLLYLQEHQISHLLIVDEQGLLMGMVTKGDLLQLFNPSASAISKHQQHELALLDNHNRLTTVSDQSSDIFLLKMSENLEQFSKALSHAMEGVAMLDLQGQYVHINQAYANMLGYSPAAMIGMNWQVTVHPDELEAMQLAYQYMLDNGKVEVETRGIRIDGSIFYKQLVMVTAYDLSQQTIGHYCFMKDISDRKQTEAQLLQQEEFLKSIYEGAEQAIFVIDITTERGFRYAGFNPVSEKYLGVTNEQIRGKTPVEAFGDAVGSNLEHNYLLCLETGNSINYEEQINFPTHTIWTLTTLSPLEDEQGRIYRIIGTATDISDRKQKEVELENQKQDLMRSNAELQQFAYIASHDLQEPLRMITSYLELLERRYQGQLDAKADKFIAYAVDGANRMQVLINDLLSYSRVGSREQDLQLVDCKKIVQNVLINLKMSIEQSDAIITYEPLPQVNADPSQLTQLFQNLISNAIKFRHKDPPQIHIGVQSTDGKWLFSVKDNGIGMEVQYLDRIFVIFQRLHGKTEYPGTGIGLAVCKKIIERHGGILWVESEPEHGSTFYFTLPDVKGSF